MKKLNRVVVMVFGLMIIIAALLFQYPVNRSTVFIAYSVGIGMGISLRIALSSIKTDWIQVDDQKSEPVCSHDFTCDTNRYIADNMAYRIEYFFTCKKCHEKKSILLAEITTQIDNAISEIKRLEALDLAGDIKSSTLPLGSSWDREKYTGKHVTLVIDYFKEVHGIDLTQIPA